MKSMGTGETSAAPTRSFNMDVRRAAPASSSAYHLDVYVTGEKNDEWRCVPRAKCQFGERLFVNDDLFDVGHEPPSFWITSILVLNLTLSRLFRGCLAYL